MNKKFANNFLVSYILYGEIFKRSKFAEYDLYIIHETISYLIADFEF